MAITGINNSSYTSYYASNYKNTVKKTDSEKDSTNTKDGNVTTSTVELKTSRPGVTKTEQMLIYGKEATTQIENSVPYYSVSSGAVTRKCCCSIFMPLK